MTQIRLPLLTREYLESKVYNETLLQSSSQCLSLCNEAIQCYDNPVQRLYLNSLPRQSKKNDFGLIYVITSTMIEWFVNGKWYWSKMLNVEEEFGYSDFVAVELDKKIHFIQPLDNDLKIYDPLNHSLVDKISTNERQNFCFTKSVCVLDNCIYFTGGRSNLGHVNYVERYIVSENKWEVVTPMSVARDECAAVALNGFIYAIGGMLNNRVATKSVS